MAVIPLAELEAMALVTRATTPVMSLTAVDDFTSAVTGTDYDQYINYAAQQNANSYINTQDKSLTADNFKGTMSRVEFVYLVMNEVYGADAVQGYDTSKSGSVSGNTYTEYLQAHKFKYVLPVITAEEYKELNPLFIPHIQKPTGLYFFAFFRKIN